MRVGANDTRWWTEFAVHDTNESMSVRAQTHTHTQSMKENPMLKVNPGFKLNFYFVGHALLRKFVFSFSPLRPLTVAMIFFFILRFVMISRWLHLRSAKFKESCKLLSPLSALYVKQLWGGISQYDCLRGSFHGFQSAFSIHANLVRVRWNRNVHKI